MAILEYAVGPENCETNNKQEKNVCDLMPSRMFASRNFIRNAISLITVDRRKQMFGNIF